MPKYKIVVEIVRTYEIKADDELAACTKACENAEDDHAGDSVQVIESYELEEESEH